MRSSLIVIPVIVSLACCGPARSAVTFSFASDSAPGQSTFAATPGDVVNSLSDGEGFNDSVALNLIIDLNGADPGGAVTIASRFDFQGISAFGSHSTTPVPGGFLQYWRVGGAFSFVDAATGIGLLQVQFANAGLTSLSAAADTLGASASLQSNAGFDPTLTFTPGPGLLALGVNSASLASGQSFAFTLTSIVNGFDPAQPVGIDSIGVWMASWTSEGSFSASAVPGPWTLALLGLGMIGCCRRARR